MTNHIYRGKTLIGTIECPSESGASVFGLEVLATSVVPSEDDDNQFESYDSAERFLNRRWNEHCLANGIETEPEAPPAAPIDEEAEYYRREAEQEAAYVAWVTSQDALASEQAASVPMALEGVESQPEAKPAPVVDADPNADDELPF